MKTFIVNLPRREDRKRLFNNTNRHFLRSDKVQAEFATDVFDGEEIEYADLQKIYFDTYKEWIDPIHGTHLTKGEVGCFLTHYHLWKKCIQLNEPIIILEDDAVCTPMFDVEEVEGIIKEYNFLYLGMVRRNTSGTCGVRLVFSQSAVGWGFRTPGMPGRRAITPSNRLPLSRLYSSRSILWYWR